MAGYYLVGYTRGYYGQTNDLPQRMAAYAKSNGIKTRGPVYNTFLFDELSTMQPERYLLQIAAFVSGARTNSSTRARNRKDSKRTK